MLLSLLEALTNVRDVPSRLNSWRGPAGHDVHDRMRTLGQSITLAILQAAVNMANRTVRSTTLLPTISLVPQRR